MFLLTCVNVDGDAEGKKKKKADGANKHRLRRVVEDPICKI